MRTAFRISGNHAG